jgi:hypothetical protein
MSTQPTDLSQFEAWMRPLLHYTHYSDGWFWNQYKRKFGVWPTLDMLQRSIKMRAKYTKGK